jgi:TRAP-type C4-dicarboxylate transport system permease small subunit
MLEKIHRALSALESLAGLLASACMFAIMAVVAVDVVLRYFFNAPLSWSYDVVSLYLMVALVFLSLAVTQRDGHHVRVDILSQRLPRSLRHLLGLLAGVPAAALMGGIAWLGAVKTGEDWQSHAVSAGAIPWPSWLTSVFVPIGMGLLALRLLLEAAARAVALATGREVLASLDADEDAAANAS